MNGFGINPQFDWHKFGGNALTDIGYGLTRAPTVFGGLAAGAQRSQEMQPYRDAAERLKAEDEAKKAAMLEQAANRAKYADMFSKQGASPLLVDMVRNGDANPAEAFWDLQRQNQPGTPVDPSSTVGGRAQLAQAWGLSPDEAKAYVLTNKLPSSVPADAPSGYQWGNDGRTLTFIPGGPHDPANKPQQGMSATMQKELFEADETVVAGQGVTQALDSAIKLNQLAIDGPLAEQRAYAGALLGDPYGQATLELKNIVTQQALEQLKVIFGAMPTEGERKVLLEIQGSVDQPRAVRAKIYQRAKELAERRIAANKQKAEALRSGTYFDEGFSPIPNAPSATSTGVQWSYEP